MATSSTGTSGSTSDWGADFFGSLNEMPSEPVTGIGQVLEAMSTLPAFRDARNWLLRHLGHAQGSNVIEAGCGNAAALTDVLSTVGTKGRLVGIDPTKAFVESAVQGPHSSAHPTPDLKWGTFARSHVQTAVRCRVL